MVAWGWQATLMGGARAVGGWEAQLVVRACAGGGCAGGVADLAMCGGGLQWPLLGGGAGGVLLRYIGALRRWSAHLGESPAPAGASDGDARGRRLPPGRRRCYGDSPSRLQGKPMFLVYPGTVDGGVFRIVSLLEGIN